MLEQTESALEITVDVLQLQLDALLEDDGLMETDALNYLIVLDSMYRLYSDLRDSVREAQ